jgi:hypothetical protein
MCGDDMANVESKMQAKAAEVANEQGGTTSDCESTTQRAMPKQMQAGMPDLTGRSSASSKIGGAPGRD